MVQALMFARLAKKLVTSIGPVGYQIQVLVPSKPKVPFSVKFVPSRLRAACTPASSLVLIVSRSRPMLLMYEKSVIAVPSKSKFLSIWSVVYVVIKFAVELLRYGVKPV